MAFSNPFKHVYTCGKGDVKVWDVGDAKDTKLGTLVTTVDCLVSFRDGLAPDGV